MRWRAVVYNNHVVRTGLALLFMVVVSLGASATPRMAFLNDLRPPLWSTDPLLAGGDYTGDGKTDYLKQTEEGLVVYPGNGDATLGAPVVTPVGENFWTLRAQGDVNGDGRTDLLYSVGTSAISDR
jgi:hypothetical protein